MGVIFKKRNYWLDYRVNGRRKREKIGPNKALAETVWAKRQVEIAENRFLDIRRSQKIRFNDFAEKFYQNYCLPNNRSPEKSAGTQLKVLKKFFGNRYLYDIKQIDVEKFKMQRIQEVKPSSVNRALACLKNLYNRAIDWGDFEGINPVKKVKAFREDNHRTRYLEKEEIKRLLPHCEGSVGKMIIVALNTGMRRGEIMNLKWQDIDFKQGQIYLLQTKNGKRRIVPMNDFLTNTLIGIRKNPNSPYVFCKPNGEKYHSHRTAFSSILKRAGIEGLRFHDLRHSFSSHLVMLGVDLVTIKELLGHSDLRMTLRYSHLSQDHKKRAVNSLTQHMGTNRTREALATQPASSENFINI